MSDLGLTEGTPLQLELRGGTLRVRPSEARHRLSEMASRIRAGKVHRATDWGWPRGREAW